MQPYPSIYSHTRPYTDIRPYHDSSFWSLINIVCLSTLWSYPITSPLTLCPHSPSIGARNRCPKLGIVKSYDASLSEVNLILLHTLCIWVSLKWCTFCDMWWKNGSSWQCLRCGRWALQVCCHASAVYSRLETFAQSISYQPCRATYESVSSI